MRWWLAIALVALGIAAAWAMPPEQQIIMFGGQSSASGSGGGGGGSCANGNLLLQYNDACQLMSQMVGN